MQAIALDAAVKSLTGAEAAGTVFNVLIEALAGAAPRGAIFLARRGEIRGWSSFGYTAEATKRQSAFSSPLHTGRLGQMISGLTTDDDRADGCDPDFGQRQADESLLTTVSVKGKAIAAILVERDAQEQPWNPSTVAVLGAFAQMRLELTLAQRKLSAAESSTVPSAAIRGAADPHAPAVPPSDSTREEPGGTAATALVESTEDREEAPNLELAAARRFARLVATDIRLYNEEAVALGRRHRDLAERLRPSIARGLESFVERHGDLGDSGLDLLHEAYVNVLAAGDAELLPASLLRRSR